ncbi:MAG: T9SS type A sorting domain-containing protein [Bacteroidia bacterium]
MEKYDPKLLEGFNAAEAKEKARQRTTKPAEQKEYFETLRRQYIVSQQISLGELKTIQFADPFALNPSAQSSSYCPNADFGNMNFSTWTGDTYTNSSGTPWNMFTPNWAPGIMTPGNNVPAQPAWPGIASPFPNRHTIMTIPPTINAPPLCVGWDSIAVDPATHLSAIAITPLSSNGSTCRLGNANNMYNETERLSYSMAVTSQNALFTYSYALVIFDGSHAQTEQAFFQVSVRDQAGNVQPCIYSVNATQAAANSAFTEASVYRGAWFDPPPIGNSNNAIYYKPWAIASIDLSAYIGQVITVDFQTADCVYGGHWCYAYIDAGCQSLNNELSFCNGSSLAYCVAPSGCSSYQWCGPNSMTPISGATDDTLLISNPVIGDVYTVSTSSASTCTTNIPTTLQNTTVTILSTSSYPSCQGTATGSATVVATGSSGGYTYQWTGPFGSIAANSATLTNLSAGTYSVHISSPSCGFKDTTVVVNTLFPTLTVTTQFSCGNSMVVNAPPGSGYTWYDSALSPVAGSSGVNPLIVPNTGNTNYTVAYLNPNGCIDSLKILMQLQVNYSTQTVSVCGNDVTLNTASGATNITWYDAYPPYTVIGHGQNISISSPVASTWLGYRVGYQNPTTGCRDSILFFIEQQIGMVYTTNLQDNCSSPAGGGQATIVLNTTAIPTYDYTVTSPNGYYYSMLSSASLTIPITSLAPDIYSVTATAGSCTYSNTFTINSSSHSVNLSYNTNVLCGNDSTIITIDTSGFTLPACQLVTGNYNNGIVSSVGTATSQNLSYDYPTVYGNYYANEKYQILYTAADLQAAGLTAGGLRNIAFKVVNIPMGMNTTFTNYTIKIACTNAIDLGPVPAINSSVASVTAPFVTVYGPQNYTTSTGWQTHDFIQPYNWDGISNIIIEICYDWISPSLYSNNAIIENAATPYFSYSVLHTNAFPVCNANTINASYKQRPVTKFGTAHLFNPNNYTYQWSPSAGLSSTTGLSTVATPTVTTTYVLTSTSTTGGCNGSDTVTVYVNQVPQPVITQNGNVLTATQGTAYQWTANNVIISGATSQTYTVTQNDTIRVIVTYGNCGSDTSAAKIMNLTGVNTLITSMDFNLYPNPAQQKVNIVAEGVENGTVSLVTITGQNIITSKIPGGQSNYSISLEGIPPGLYFVRITNVKGECRVKKLVVE